MRRIDDSFKIINELASELKSRNAQLYYFGGYMRDFCLRKQSKNIHDIDIRVIGITKEEFLAILRNVAEKYDTGLQIVGRRFEIIKLRGFDIDFSSPENEDGTVRTFEDIKDSADFTINALFKNVRKKTVIDNHNGKKDLDNKCIRLVSPEREEPFLALRAAKLKAKLARKYDKNGKIIWGEIDGEWKLDEESRQIMLGYNYADINYERLRDLLKKVMFSSEYVQSVFFRELSSLGVLGNVLSPLEQLESIEVDVNGRKMNGFGHTVRMLDYLMRFKTEFSAEFSSKDEEKFESLYMICLTYHFRDMYRGEEEIKAQIREFLVKIKTLKKTKAAVGYCKNHEDSLIKIYNNWRNMSDEELVKQYVKHREKMENIGYFVESYNLAGIDSLTSEQYKESKDRLFGWNQRMKHIKEISRRTVKVPRKPVVKGVLRIGNDGNGNARKPRWCYNWGDLKPMLDGIPDTEMSNWLGGVMRPDGKREAGGGKMHYR